jgi:hypothetical protein
MDDELSREYHLGARNYFRETVTCGSTRCEEPTTRGAVYCVLCVADEECGIGPKLAEPKRDFAAEKRAANKRHLERTLKRRRREYLLALAMFMAFMLGLLNYLLVSQGYIPS